MKTLLRNALLSLLTAILVVTISGFFSPAHALTQTQRRNCQEIAYQFGINLAGIETLRWISNAFTIGSLSIYAVGLKVYAQSGDMEFGAGQMIGAGGVVVGTIGAGASRYAEIQFQNRRDALTYYVGTTMQACAAAGAYE